MTLKNINDKKLPKLKLRDVENPHCLLAYFSKYFPP